MNIEVLISCMHQVDASIIQRTNVQSDVLVINQCDENCINEFFFLNKYDNKCRGKIINTTERGLSRSRNMALKNATGDICLLCDDDELLVDDISVLVNDAYKKYAQADLIAFKLEYPKKYPSRVKRIGYLSALKIASWQLSFKRSSIISSGIVFDESIGSGVSKAGGEEVLFIYDCLKKGLKVFYVPICLGRVNQSNNETSQWFRGYNADYFYDRGIFTRKLLGRIGAIIYAFYFVVVKYRLYVHSISFFNAMKYLLRGIFKS